MFRQAVQHNSMINSRVPVSTVLSDSSQKTWVIKKLKYVAEIKKFAEKEGLNVEGSYNHYVELERSGISYLVYAAERDSLVAKKWYFPFVGRVPYLGYFSELERDEMASELAAEGWDVAKGTVGAFSSLGWFEDPIFTPMLRRRNASLAHLFFHELTHRTFWSQGSVRFNENLAEFIAGKLTEKFLYQNRDLSSLSKYKQAKRDRKRYKAWLKMLKSDLERFYDLKQTMKAMMKGKREVFSRHLSRLPSFETEYRNYIKGKAWNNATVVSASLYTPDFERFEASYRCLNPKRIGDFLSAIEEWETTVDEPLHLLGGFCDRAEEARSVE